MASQSGGFLNILSGCNAFTSAISIVSAGRPGWTASRMDAKGLYAVLAVATLLGLAINFPAVQRHTHLTPTGALFWSAVVNGVVAFPIMAVMMLMFHNRKVRGQFNRVWKTLWLTGWLATAVMAAAAIGIFATWNR